MPPGTFTVNLNTIWGPSGSDIFTVGDGGYIAHYAGSYPGGLMDSGTTENLYDVWGSSGYDVFTVGANGTILHYSPPPYCQTVYPQYGNKGQTLDVTIIGSNTHFTDPESSVSFSCSGITVNSSTVTSPTEVTANITIAPDAPGNSCNVTVTTGSEVMTCEDAFLIIQPPANDDFDNATAITALPFTDRENTIGATSAADDPTDCYGTYASVWYELTSITNFQIKVDTSSSDYYTVVAVYTGTRGNLNLVDCRDYCFTMDVRAGETYYFMVTSYYGECGNMVFTVDVAPPPPPPLTIDLKVDPVNFVNNGITTVSGTVNSSEPVDAYVSVQVRQKAGRVFITGYNDMYVYTADGVAHWTMQVPGDIGPFLPGKVTVRAIASGCTYRECSDYGECAESPEVSTAVRLQRAKR
jgi:hypothetical protein